MGHISAHEISNLLGGATGMFGMREQQREPARRRPAGTSTDRRTGHCCSGTTHPRKFRQRERAWSGLARIGRRLFHAQRQGPAGGAGARARHRSLSVRWQCDRSRLRRFAGWRSVGRDVAVSAARPHHQLHPQRSRARRIEGWTGGASLLRRRCDGRLHRSTRPGRLRARHSRRLSR